MEYAKFKIQSYPENVKAKEHNIHNAPDNTLIT